MIIGIDFDGTILTHEYPELGKEVPKAMETLKELNGAGHKLILWTMRSEGTLDDAVKYLTDNGIPLFGININPEQDTWTTSPKAYCHLYIDDAAFGCPLIQPPNDSRPYVDWVKVNSTLKEMKLI